MNNFALLLKSFLPRSRVTLALQGVILIAAAVLPTLLTAIAKEPHPWMSQHGAVSTLTIVGITLGVILARIRGWTSSPLVPGLLKAQIWSAGAVIFLLWMIYALLMHLQGTDFGLAITLSLGFGMVGLLLGTYILPFWLMFSGVALMVVSESVREQVMGLLADPSAEFALGGFSLFVPWYLSRRLTRAESAERQAIWERIAHPAADLPSGRWTRWQYRMRLSPMSPRAAFTAVFEHSTIQAWLNSITLFGLLTSAMLVVLVLRMGQVPDNLCALYGSFTYLVGATVPLLQRQPFAVSQTQLYLSGVYENRERFYAASLATLQRFCIRYSLLGAIFVLLLLWQTSDLVVWTLSANLVLLTPGIGSVLLIMALLLEHTLKDANGNALLLGFLHLAVLGLGGYVSVICALDMDMWVGMVCCFLASLLSVVSTRFIYGRWMSRWPE